VAEREGESLADGGEARPGGAGQRIERADPTDREDREHERHDIDGVRPADADAGDEQAADRRPDHLRRL